VAVFAVTDETQVEVASLTATAGTCANAGVALPSGYSCELLVLLNIADVN
jgi:hypothetical protein